LLFFTPQRWLLTPLKRIGGAVVGSSPPKRRNKKKKKKKMHQSVCWPLAAMVVFLFNPKVDRSKKKELA